MLSATAARAAAGVATLAGWCATARDDGRQAGRVHRNRQPEDGHEDGRLGQRGDHRFPAGAHAAERRAGVEPGERQGDGAEQQQADDGEEVTGSVQR